MTDDPQQPKAADPRVMELMRSTQEEADRLDQQSNRGQTAIAIGVVVGIAVAAFAGLPAGVVAGVVAAYLAN